MLKIMKNLFLLSVILLASCAPVQRQAPFKPGDTLTVSSAPKGKETWTQKITIRDSGDWKSNKWYFEANGISVGSAILALSDNNSSIIVMDEDKQANEVYNGCLAFPEMKSPDWKVASGFSLSGNLDNLLKEVEEKLSQTTGNALTAFAEIYGTCTITRQ